jgi:hypothetical protein
MGSELEAESDEFQEMPPRQNLASGRYTKARRLDQPE